MKVIKNILLVAFSLLALGYAAHRGFESLAPLLNPQQPTPPTQREEAFFRTPWQTESEYAVWAISEEIARMSSFAAKKSVPAGLKVEVETKDPNPDHPVYSVTVNVGDGTPQVRQNIVIGDSLWAEENYVPLAEALLSAGHFKVGSPSSDGEENLLLATDLQSNFTAAELQNQNEILSKVLARDFANPQLHDEAAVLLGAFRLREHANCFSDGRPSLNRSTAHLAMADALRGPGVKPGNIHQLGKALSELGMNRQMGALTEAANLPPSLGAWKTAIEVSATGDWRRWDQELKRTRLENLAFFQANAARVSSEMALDKLKKAGMDDGADWLRILNTPALSVGLGHRLLDSSLSSEWKEMNDVYKLYFGEPLSQEKMCEALNVVPGHCLVSGDNGMVSLHVLDWGLWADFLQRQICEVIYMNYQFIVVRWGNPAAGPEYLGSVKPFLDGLRLGPILRKLVSDNDTSYHAAMRDSYRILRDAPQTVPVRAWNMICYYPFYKQQREFPDNVLPHINEWHRPNPPPGTAMDMPSRLDHPSLTQRSDFSAKMAGLREIAPMDAAVASASRKVLPGNLSEVEQFRAVNSAMLPWMPYLQAELANLLGIDDPQAYQLMETAATMDPEMRFSYARFLVDAGKKDEAAREYEKGFQQSKDPVAAANRAEWLVVYYADQGRIDEARKLADFAAETYSERGLETKARLMERLGENEVAEEYYGKIQERYDHSNALQNFHFRQLMKTGDKEKISRAIGHVFQQGMQTVTLGELPPAGPERGIVIKEQSLSLTRAGLRAQDVIVALDGIRLASFAQYDFVRNLHSDPQMRLIVWRDGKYLEVTASPPNKKFGVDMDNFVR